MGNFCEAFGIEKIEAPSTKRKCIIKRRKPTRQPFRPKLVAKPSPAPAKPRPKGKAPKKASKNPLSVLNVANPVIKHSNAKQNKRLMNYLLKMHK